MTATASSNPGRAGIWRNQLTHRDIGASHILTQFEVGLESCAHARNYQCCTPIGICAWGARREETSVWVCDSVWERMRPARVQHLIPALQHVFLFWKHLCAACMRNAKMQHTSVCGMCFCRIRLRCCWSADTRCWFLIMYFTFEYMGINIITFVMQQSNAETRLWGSYGEDELFSASWIFIAIPINMYMYIYIC